MAKWFVETRRCHCEAGQRYETLYELYDEGEWAQPADDYDTCYYRSQEALCGIDRFTLHEKGKKFLKLKDEKASPPPHDTRGDDWFKHPPKPEWRNPDWKADGR